MCLIKLSVIQKVFLFGIIFLLTLDAQTVDLSPFPQHLTFSGKNIPIGKVPWKIVLAATPDSLSSYGAERVMKAFKEHGISEPSIELNTNPSSHAIFIGALEKKRYPSNLPSAVAFSIPETDWQQEIQGYALAFDQSNCLVYILGRDALGALYGVTALEQLVVGQGDQAQLIGATIRDWPHFKRRVFGSMESLRWIRTFEDFQRQFKERIDRYLVPTRINGITMRRGGFTFHDYDYNTDENRKRLKWAVAEARRHGIEIEYKDNAICGWDWTKRNQYPYNEIIQIGGKTYYYCYSREDLIRQTAREMGQFMADMGIRFIYLHEHDGPNLEIMWKPRCSKCKSIWPDDNSQIQFGEAQANLANIYYEELKNIIEKKPGDTLIFNLVPSFYRRGNSDYQKTVHQKLKYPDIHITMREASSQDVKDMRGWYGNGIRPFYYYIEEQWRIRPYFSLRSTGAAKYYIGNEDDVHFSAVNGGDEKFKYALMAYYSWNVNAQGSDGNYSLNVYRDVQEVRNPLSPARLAMEAVARRVYGPTWGPRVVQIHLAPLLVGYFIIHKNPSVWWNTVVSWFPQVKSESDKLGFYHMQLDEAKSIEPIAENYFSLPDVPDRHLMYEPTLYGAYAELMGTRLIAELLVLEEIAKQSKKQSDYMKGYLAAKSALSKYAHVYGVFSDSTITRRGFSNSVKPVLELYLKGFATQAKVAAYFILPSNADVACVNYDFGHKIEYSAPSGSQVALQYLTSIPNWLKKGKAKVDGDSLYGVATAFGVDTLRAVLVVDGQPADTMVLCIHRAPYLSRSGNATLVFGNQNLFAGNFQFGVCSQQINSLEMRFLVGLNKPGEFDLSIYNAMGQRIWTYEKKTLAGVYPVQWNFRSKGGKEIGKGAYFVVLKQGHRQQTDRFLVIR